ncbi:hypothetical protein BSKO_10357 [Bryopsis sp. KO-2023]|nr:hypothetical protein BSKO_10357 [Bryopsis sp. KO-2023]
MTTGTGTSVDALFKGAMAALDIGTNLRGDGRSVVKSGCDLDRLVSPLLPDGQQQGRRLFPGDNDVGNPDGRGSDIEGRSDGGRSGTALHRRFVAILRTNLGEMWRIRSGNSEGWMSLLKIKMLNTCDELFTLRGPMFFGTKVSHTSRLNQRRKEQEHTKAMEMEMETAKQCKVESGKVASEAKEAQRIKEQSKIVPAGEMPTRHKKEEYEPTESEGQNLKKHLWRLQSREGADE